MATKISKIEQIRTRTRPSKTPNRSLAQFFTQRSQFGKLLKKNLNEKTYDRMEEMTEKKN